MFDVMISDEPRYPQSKDCESKQKNKKKKPTEFGTPPTFKLTKDKMQAFEAGYYGHRVELKCPFKKGCPRAKALWYKDGQEVKRGSQEVRRNPSRVFISRSGESLTIEDNRVEDDGEYTCVVRNLFGSISHTIKVKSTPRVLAASPTLYKSQPGNHTVLLGSNLTLLCQLTVRDPGAPSNIRWYRHYQVNGSYTDPDEKVYITKMQDSESLLEGDDQELVLTNLREEDSGWYSCYVTNQFDRVVSTGYVEVISQLEQPSQVQALPLWLSAGFGVLGLVLVVVVVVMCTKYKKEKRRKVRAVENAQCVARWTKKIFIERSFVVGAGGGTPGQLSPTVRVEKVMTSPSQWLSEEEKDLYEFQLDEKWEFPREFLELKEEIGAGAFGRVFKGVAHNSVMRSEPSSGPSWGCRLVRTAGVAASTTVAVKMIKDQQSEKEVLDLVKEIEIMKAVGGHDNIVNLLGACTQPAGQPLMAILEYAEHGNLRDFLRARRGVIFSSTDQLDGSHSVRPPRPVTTKEMVRFAFQVARGMEFLAGRRCVHRDLAARNILVARGKVAKVADFGLARDLEQTDYYRRVGDGKLPVLWMSPESLFEGVSTTKSDVWSYGVLLWEIITCGERPYTGIATEALLELIRDGYRMSIPIQCPQELYQMIKSCWHLQPGLRPSWSQLVSSLQSLHSRTLPGLYLQLALPSIPTPPSSPEMTVQHHHSPQYNNVRKAIAGIAPLPASSHRSRRSSSESGYSSITRHQEYGNIFLPSAPSLPSDGENTENNEVNENTENIRE